MAAETRMVARHSVVIVAVLLLCSSVESCREPKDGDAILNHPYGKVGNSKLLLEIGRNISLSYSSTEFNSAFWTLPDNRTLSCGQTQGAVSITCSNGMSNLTITGLAMNNNGPYLCKAGKGFIFTVQVIQVDVSLSVDDSCEMIYITANLFSTDYQIQSMASSSTLDKDIIHQRVANFSPIAHNYYFRHEYLISKALSKDDFRWRKYNVTLTLRKSHEENPRCYYLTKQGSLNRPDHCNEKDFTTVSPFAEGRVGSASSSTKQSSALVHTLRLLLVTSFHLIIVKC